MRRLSLLLVWAVVLGQTMPSIASADGRFARRPRTSVPAPATQGRPPETLRLRSIQPGTDPAAHAAREELVGHLRSRQGSKIRASVRSWIDRSHGDSMHSRNVASTLRTARALLWGRHADQASHVGPGVLVVGEPTRLDAIRALDNANGRGDAVEGAGRHNTSWSEGPGKVGHGAADALSTFFHEELHGYSSMFALFAYTRSGRVLEEVITELHSRELTRSILDTSDGILFWAYQGEIERVRGAVQAVLGTHFDVDARIREAGRYAWRSTIWTPGHYVNRFVDGLGPLDSSQRESLRLQLSSLRMEGGGLFRRLVDRAKGWLRARVHDWRPRR